MFKISAIINFMALLRLCGSTDLNVEHTHAFPIEIYSTAESTVLISPLKEDVCCGESIVFEGGIGKLNLKKCSKYITCVKSPEFRKTILETDCKEGYPSTMGCLKTITTGEGKALQTNKCFCTKFGAVCSDGLFDVTCDNLKDAIITEDDEILFVDSNSDKLNTISIREVFLKANHIFDVIKDSPIDLESASIKSDHLIINLKNAKNRNCDVKIGSSVCSFVCKSENCKHQCIVKAAGNELKVKLFCGDFKKVFWLFRSDKPALSYVKSYASWRSHSATFCTLLIIDICIGYILIRLTTGLCYMLYNIVRSVFSVFNAAYFKYILSSSVPLFDSCEICKMYPTSIYDAYLHDRYCIQQLCPYCKDDVLDVDHIKLCTEKKRAIALLKNEKKSEIAEKVKIITREYKTSVWTNEMSRRRIPYKIWISTLIFLIIMTLIAPSSALMNKPCTKLVGRTAGCSSKHDSDSLGNDIDEHNHWSAIETGMLATLEKEHLNDEFASNAIHRLKTTDFHFNGNSEETLEILGKNCKSNGVCRTAALVSWASDVFKGNLQSFKTSEAGHHDSTLNVFIADAEAVYYLAYEYSTTNWDIQTESFFSCTETDCDKVCVKRTNEKHCEVFRKLRSKDTSWAHNPAWCWSINSGCTCAQGFIRQHPDSSVYNVYSVEKGILKALVCMESNNVFIDCQVVDRTGTMHLGKNKLQVTRWALNLKPPKRIIVEVKSGSNKKHYSAITGPTCEKERCSLGDAGDFQFTNLSCNYSKYFNPSGVQVNLNYDFGKTPRWETSYPRSGANRFQKYRSLDTETLDHHVSLYNNELIYDEGTFGSFALELTVNDFEVYEILDDSTITDFKIARCVGEYISNKGAICTFLVTLENAEKTTVKVVSNDDSTFIQNDVQMIVSGQNGFRKFMYVRNNQQYYSFCIVHKKQKLCDNFKNNFTKPNYDWSVSTIKIKEEHTSTVGSECDMWFGLTCIFKRILDFFKTVWSCIIWVIIGLASSYIIKIVYDRYVAAVSHSESLPLVETKTAVFDSAIRKVAEKKINI
uniref:Glycoprotein n=1 Tax=Coptotermes formosanus bunya-like virus 1 TaxID=3133450 RepID=A0AAT9JG18_9VIRU